MYENIILAPDEYKNEASTFAQQNGGVVIVSHTVFVEQNGNFSETKNSSTAHEINGLKVIDGYEKCESNEENYGTTSNYSTIENALCQTGKMVNPQVYIVSLVNIGSISSNEYEMLYKAAEILNKIPNLDIWIIESDGKPRFLPKL